METFILWSVTPDQSKTGLSFFASWVQAQRIKDGTPALVSAMLEDLGFQAVEIHSWSLTHFVTNYLADDPQDPDWRAVWTDTVEIQVSLAEPVKVEAGNTTLVRTYAADQTWDGDDHPPMPPRCVVVVDFASKQDAQTVAGRLAQVGRLPETGGDHAFQDLPGQVGDRLIALSEQLFILGQPKNAAPAITVSPRGADGTQLAIALGEFDSSFYEHGAGLAHAVMDICRALNGAPTWNESTDR